MEPRTLTEQMVRWTVWTMLLVAVMAMVTLTPEILLAAGEEAAEGAQGNGGLLGWIVGLGSAVVGGGGILVGILKAIAVIYDKFDKARDLDEILEPVYEHGQAGMALLDYVGAENKAQRKAKLKGAKAEIKDVLRYWRGKTSKDD